MTSLCLLVASGLPLCAGPAFAGPPYVTDDPEPAEPGHWEINSFVVAAHVPGDTAGEAGFDINYGALKDLQLTAVIPVDFESHTRTGLGDIQLGVKYRFLHQAEGSPMPDVAFFPTVLTPTAGPEDDPERLGILLPVWAQKDFGVWSLFGGGGYDVNPGPGQRNFWLGGVGLSRALTERFALGGEIYCQTATSRESKAFAGVDIGGAYRMTDHWSLLASAGPGIQNAREGGQFVAYLALQANY